jgi:hypothetical protein
VNFVLHIEDSACLKSVYNVNSTYFGDELCRRFNIALAESGIYERGNEGGSVARERFINASG